jgi:solute carrier family 35 (UDP-sugar transporter), member A1/2/3
MMVFGASMLSGLSAALTQRALVGSKPRHPLFFSAELAVYGIIFLLLNAIFNSKESATILAGGLFNHWTLMTLIPVTTNAFGGLVVGLVTKYAGGVVKGFALIAGLIVTGIAQWIVENKPLQNKDWRVSLQL